MKKQQFFRLTLVLILPLLGLGWWFADMQLGEMTYRTECSVGGKNFACHSFRSTKLQSYQDSMTGGLYVGMANYVRGAKVDGLHGTKITAAKPQIESSKTSPDVVADLTKTTIGGIVNAELRRNEGHCALNRIIDSNFHGQLICNFKAATPFTFDNSDDHVMFGELVQKVYEMGEKNVSNQRNQFALLVLAPLLAFFLLSAVIALLSKCIRFVIHGTNPKPQ